MIFEIVFSVHFPTFRYISVHGDMYLIFFDLRMLDFVFCGSELTDSWKRTKLNGKGSDLPDRISSVLNVSLSNINVDGYICKRTQLSRPKAP